jgi:hypothetical protein
MSAVHLGDHPSRSGHKLGSCNFLAKLMLQAK